MNGIDIGTVMAPSSSGIVAVILFGMIFESQFGLEVFFNFTAKTAEPSCGFGLLLALKNATLDTKYFEKVIKINHLILAINKSDGFIDDI